MLTKSTWLAAASLGALALVAAPADAKPAKRTSASRSQNDEIRALRAQVEALTARLDAQQAAQAEATARLNSAADQPSQAAAAAQAAQTQAAAAQTQAAAAQTAVPEQVKTALASQPKAKPQWFDNTSISGRMYFNFSRINQDVNGVNSPNNGTGFNIKRFYLSVDHKFNDVFSGDITTDIDNVIGSTSKNNFVNGANSLVGKGLYVKKAYLQAKLDPALIIRLGAADTPWVPYVEGVYGFRHVENIIIDRTNYGTSADWGVHVLGDLAGGLVSYQLSAVNGAGYRNVKVTNSIDLEGRVSLNYKGIQAAVGGYTGKRGNDVEGTVTPHTASRLDALLAYKGKMFTVGGEYFTAKNWNNVTTAATDKSDGWSLFGNVNFAEKWSVFGRYDRVKPTKTTNDRLKDEYFNVGIQWEPVKIVNLALVYKRERAVNGTIATTNGVIGGPNPVGTLSGGRGTYDEFGLFGQFRF